jgi:hypothetical protein
MCSTTTCLERLGRYDSRPGRALTARSRACRHDRQMKARHSSIRYLLDLFLSPPQMISYNQAIDKRFSSFHLIDVAEKIDLFFYLSKTRRE